MSRMSHVINIPVNGSVLLTQGISGLCHFIPAANGSMVITRQDGTTQLVSLPFVASEWFPLNLSVSEGTTVTLTGGGGALFVN